MTLLGLETALRFPAFFYSVMVLYWSAALNHRSWADMLVDQYVTEGRSMFMSRWAMLAVFPPLMASMLAMRIIVMFKRGSIADKDGFNKWIDRKLAESTQTALTVYPEGHRSTRGQSLPLKRGMLHYAFSRKMPVQVIIGLNKEAILSEKHLVARFGQTVGVGYSEAIDPAKFDSFDAFWAQVQSTWDAQWQQVFTAKLEGLPELHLSPPDYDYPPSVRRLMALCIPANILLLAASLYLALRCAATLLALCGPLQWPVTLVMSAWVAASFVLAWQPVNALEEQSRRHQRCAVREGAAGGGAATVAQRKLD
ncbi:hypothetical protein N2152v2_011158 [Parachlorella kessleri]